MYPPTSSLNNIAHDLTNHLYKLIANDQLDDVAFITHSQGGLLARRYLANDLLKPTHSREVTPIFRLLAFATAHWGAVSETVGLQAVSEKRSTGEISRVAQAAVQVFLSGMRTELIGQLFV